VHAVKLPPLDVLPDLTNMKICDSSDEIEPLDHAIEDLPHRTDLRNEEANHWTAPAQGLQAEPAAIQELFMHWLASMTQLDAADAQQDPTMEITTWFLDMPTYLNCDVPRSVLLGQDFSSWMRLIATTWLDLLDPTLPISLYLVRPSPPVTSLQQHQRVHVIVLQRAPADGVANLFTVVATHQVLQPMRHFARFAPHQMAKPQVIGFASLSDQCYPELSPRQCTVWHGDLELRENLALRNRHGIAFVIIIQEMQHIIDRQNSQPQFERSAWSDDEDEASVSFIQIQAVQTMMNELNASECAFHQEWPENLEIPTVTQEALCALHEDSEVWLAWLRDPLQLRALQWLWYLEQMNAASPYAPRIVDGFLECDIIAIPQANVPPLNCTLQTTDPVAPSPRVTIELTIATANVLTLRQSGLEQTGTSISRQQVLMQQFHDAKCTFVGIQETRHKHLVGINNELFHVIGHPADLHGNDGVQLWISKQQPLHESGPCIGKDQIRIIASSSTFLIVKINTDCWKCVIVTGRAPHSARPRQEAEAYWRTISEHLQRKASGWPLIYCGDANAHVGDCPTSAIGPLYPSQENQAGFDNHDGTHSSFIANCSKKRNDADGVESYTCTRRGSRPGSPLADIAFNLGMADLLQDLQTFLMNNDIYLAGSALYAEGEPDFAWWDPTQHKELVERCFAQFAECLHDWANASEPTVVDFHNKFFNLFQQMHIPEFQAARVFIFWIETAFQDIHPTFDIDLYELLEESHMTMLEDLHTWQLRLRMTSLQKQWERLEAGPRPLRGDQDCWGLLNLSFKELQQVAIGNELLLRGLLLCAPVALHGGATTLEHPAPPLQEERPSIWRTGILKLLSSGGRLFRHYTFQQWKHGAEGIKPTTLLYSHAPIPATFASNEQMDLIKPVVPLIGRGSDGRFRTARAKEYPPGMNRCLAEAFWSSISTCLAEVDEAA
ncbi:unnamed protein product, partial [Cladocopium goreaui]